MVGNGCLKIMACAKDLKKKIRKKGGAYVPLHDGQVTPDIIGFAELHTLVLI